MAGGHLVLQPFHPGQQAAFSLPARFKAVRCGRRWGKTAFGSTMASVDVGKGRFVGWFAPDYKRLAETYNDVLAMLEPIKIRSARAPQGVIYTAGGGRIDFWTLEDANAGRGRKYHRAIIDEAAFTKSPQMTETWEKAIRPTLLDYAGRATVLSNTNGVDEENFFYRICNDPKYGFKEYHAPCHQNPFLPADELAKLERDNDPNVYRQEYLAEFVDWSGVSFFSREKLLVNDLPLDWPTRAPIDAVFAVIDTAVKDGKENDGTGVIYFGLQRNKPHPLLILDWDIIQIEGALLEKWLPAVGERLEQLAREGRARQGSLGPMIEDRQSGSILLQQARHRGWRATALPEKLTDLGKDGRAINVSGHVYQGKVKFTQPAYDKVRIYKGTSRNHLLSQVTGFRIGDKEGYKRADDLLDCFTYGVAVALGDSSGL